MHGISRLDAAGHWGDGTTSASASPCRTRCCSRPSTRFNDFALEFYSFVVADNYAPFYSRPIECTDRDAPFVLDGVLYHESDLDLEENGARLEGHMATLDTHAIARTLTDAGADPKLADAITAAVREAADHGDHVTPDQFKAGLAEMEARLTWRFAGAMLAQTGVILAAVIGAAVAILRMLG